MSRKVRSKIGASSRTSGFSAIGCGGASEQAARASRATTAAARLHARMQGGTAFVSEAGVELRDASEVWGKGVHDTVAFFEQRYGEKDLSVCTIGPAGERLSLFATWLNEMDRAFGRGGTGAVGGSKQLKAIVIRAPRSKSQVPDAERWKQVRKQTLDIIRDESKITSPKKGGLSVYGTNVLMNITNGIGALPTRNGQETAFGDKAELLSGEYVKEHILVNDPTCHACPVACTAGAVKLLQRLGTDDVLLPRLPLGGVEQEGLCLVAAHAAVPVEVILGEIGEDRHIRRQEGVMAGSTTVQTT